MPTKLNTCVGEYVGRFDPVGTEVGEDEGFLEGIVDKDGCEEGSAVGWEEGCEDIDGE